MSSTWQLPLADPDSALRAFADRRAKLASPRHRTMLQTLIDHIRCVIVCDLDGVMATMVAEPAFSTWGPQGDSGRKGSEAVRAGYEHAFTMPDGPIANQVHAIENLVIDDNAIALELTSTRIWPAKMARVRGYDVPDQGGYYAVRHRTAVIIPFDEAGLIRGEHTYGGAWPPVATDFEPVTESQLTSEYLAWLKTQESATA